MSNEMTRRPAVAGQFYPGDAEELRETVEQHMERTGVVPAPERVVAVIATGGYAGLIARETDVIDFVNVDLTLEGLRIIYEMNRG